MCDLTRYGKGIKYYKYYYHDGLAYKWDDKDKVEITKEEYNAIWD
jgi:hypothetical protein